MLLFYIVYIVPGGRGVPGGIGGRVGPLFLLLLSTTLTSDFYDVKMLLFYIAYIVPGGRRVPGGRGGRLLTDW